MAACFLLTLGKSMKARPYLLSYSLFVLAWWAWNSSGWLTFLPLAYAFLLIPLVELIGKPDKHNGSEEEQAARLADKRYDQLLYAVVPLHLGSMAFFLYRLASAPTVDDFTWWGWVSAMGILNGVFGINVAHELGHRPKKHEQRMAQALLCSSLYMHFFIEHNRGHHRYVATHEDPASARKWEPVYLFWIRSIVMSWWSAWKLEADRLRRQKKPWLHLSNQMLQFTLTELAVLALVFVAGGTWLLFAFVMAALMGIVLLETVNYIEHYGLRRKKVSAHRYENVMPRHSWNSNHHMGRWMLFELSRHSDHHHRPARKYQILEHHEDSPQMPTGYPGMMLISLLPPLFYAIVHPRLTKYASAQ